MKLIITERQLKLITERIGPNLGNAVKSGSDLGVQYPNYGVGTQHGFHYGNAVKSLFDDAKSWTSTPQDWKNISGLAVQIKNAMSGLGSGNILDLLKQVNTKPKLSALVKNWKYDGHDLYQWLYDEWGLDWEDVYNVFLKNFPKDISRGNPVYN